MFEKIHSDEVFFVKGIRLTNLNCYNFIVALDESSITQNF